MKLNTPYMDPMGYFLFIIYIHTFDTSIYMYIYFYVHMYVQYIMHVPRADYPGNVRVWEEGESSKGRARLLIGFRFCPEDMT